MKKRLFCLLLALLVAAAAAAPAMAYTEYGIVYDETEALGSDALTVLGTETLPQATTAYGVDLRVDIFDSLDNEDGIRASAKYVYDNYSYGAGESYDGVSLTVVALPDDTGYTVQDWCIYASGGDAQAVSKWENSIYAAVQPFMASESWAGELTQDQAALAGAVQAMAQGLEDAFAAPAAPETPTYVFDGAGLLSSDEIAQLEVMAAQVAADHGCGIYIMTVEDHGTYGLGDVYETAYGIYHGNDLGIGPDRNGVTILLSMAERDYATFFYGEFTEYAFNEYGQEKLESVFLDDFGDNDWFMGFYDLICECDEYLALAEAGKPVRVNVAAAFGLGFLFALPLAALITLIIRKVMLKSVDKGREASEYVTPEGLNLLERWDHFTHTTVTTRNIAKKSESRSGGGGSGRSGKF